MSLALISRSPDLLRLREEGYEIAIVSNHLLVKEVPYVTANRQVRRGVLVSTLALAGDRTIRPDTHVAYFIGEQPCDHHGTELKPIVHQQKASKLAPGLVVDRSFSSKPSSGYADYYEKMTTYAAILSGPAQALDPRATAKTFVVEDQESASVFEYVDTATTRAEIGAVSARLSGHKIGIVGLGGTGSYVLDLMAKTPVAEIHLFDGDRFHQHNAFRAPGAASLDELRELPMKVDYFKGIYSCMRRGIHAHATYLGQENAGLLTGLDFVFLCLDDGPARGALLEVLRREDKAFVDVGMGVELIAEEGCLIGTIRVSTSTPSHRSGDSRIPVSETQPDEDYDKNIQIADLNCLNAALAVVRWKKLCGFYQDLENEHFSAYAINCNQLASEERP